jgi:alkanesulfonate monooxygenase
MERPLTSGFPLRFHWSLSAVGDSFRRTLPVERQSGTVLFDQYAEFCQIAERNGIESLLMAIGCSRPDPTLLSAALACSASRIKFMVACRSGLISPAYFVQQVNSLASLTDGRVHVNMVLGHTPHELRQYGDFLSHEERVRRTDEFLSICHAYWNAGGGVDFEGTYYRIVAGRIRTPFRSPGRTRPEIFIGGSSEDVTHLAARHADCLWRFPDTLESLRRTKLCLDRVELGILVSLIARPTHKEAWDQAEAMVQGLGESAAGTQRRFIEASDSVGFRAVYHRAVSSHNHAGDACLWTGAVPYLGAPAAALVGSFEEICDTLLLYRASGVSQFLFMGWPDGREVEYFGKGVLPLLREREKQLERPACI